MSLKEHLHLATIAAYLVGAPMIVAVGGNALLALMLTVNAALAIAVVLQEQRQP